MLMSNYRKTKSKHFARSANISILFFDIAVLNYILLSFNSLSFHLCQIIFFYLRIIVILNWSIKIDFTSHQILKMYLIVTPKRKKSVLLFKTHEASPTINGNVFQTNIVIGAPQLSATGFAYVRANGSWIWRYINRYLCISNS